MLTALHAMSSLCSLSCRVIVLCVPLNLRKMFVDKMQGSHAGSCVKYAWCRVCLQVLATLAVQVGNSRLHILDMGEDTG